MELKNKKISFIGDSITFGLGASEKQNRYTDVLAENTGLREIKNRGINGTRIARQQNVNPEWESDTNAFVERFSDIEEDTDIIVIFGGTNDHGHGDVPFGEDDDFTMDTFCGALNYLFQGLM